MTEYLFTYGYLKREHRNNPDYNVPNMPITWIGNGKYSGRIYRVANYPGVLFDPKNQKKVSGDVYQIKRNPFFLKKMDEYELSKPLFKRGFNQYQRRKRIIAIDRKDIICWVYEYVRPVKTFSLIKSGKY